MSKKPRNKVYRPRPIRPEAGFQVIANKHAEAEMKRPLTSDQITDLGIAYHSALECMISGNGAEQDYSVVVCSLNVALILAERGIGSEYEQAIVNALDGAFKSHLRAKKVGKYGFDGNAMTAIKRAFEIHAAQVEIATKEEMKLALEEVHRRIDSGNVYREAA